MRIITDVYLPSHAYQTCPLFAMVIIGITKRYRVVVNDRQTDRQTAGCHISGLLVTRTDILGSTVSQRPG